MRDCPLSKTVKILDQRSCSSRPESQPSSKIQKLLRSSCGVEQGALFRPCVRKRLSSPLRSWLATVVILSGGSLLILNEHSKTVKMQCCLLRYANFFPLVDPPQSQNKPSGRLPCAPNGIVPVDLGLSDPLHHRSGLHVR